MSNNDEGTHHLLQEGKAVLLEHLAAQYKTYREEVRLYIGFAATSTTLLVILLFNELTAATNRDGTVNTKFYVLIPLSLVWYGALLSLFMAHVAVIEEYLKLIERKMNVLLSYDVFQFEKRYKFPRLKKEDLLPFSVFALVAGSVPITLALHAGHRGLVGGYGWSSFTAWLFVGGGVIAFMLEFLLVIRIRISRRRLNDHLFQHWEEKLRSGESAKA